MRPRHTLLQLLFIIRINLIYRVLHWSSTFEKSSSVEWKAPKKNFTRKVRLQDHFGLLEHQLMVYSRLYQDGIRGQSHSIRFFSWQKVAFRHFLVSGHDDHGHGHLKEVESFWESRDISHRVESPHHQSFPHQYWRACSCHQGDHRQYWEPELRQIRHKHDLPQIDDLQDGQAGYWLLLSQAYHCMLITEEYRESWNIKEAILLDRLKHRVAGLLRFLLDEKNFVQDEGSNKQSDKWVRNDKEEVPEAGHRKFPFYVVVLRLLSHNRNVMSLLVSLKSLGSPPRSAMKLWETLWSHLSTDMLTDAPTSFSRTPSRTQGRDDQGLAA